MRTVRVLALALLLFAGAVSALAQSITVDLWQDFEGTPLNATTLAANDHGNLGAWSVTDPETKLSISASGEKISTALINGNSDSGGTSGMALTPSDPASEADIHLAFTTDQASCSYGWWYQFPAAMVGSDDEQDMLYVENAFGANELYVKQTDHTGRGSDLFLFTGEAGYSSAIDISGSPGTWFWITALHQTGGAGSPHRLRVYDADGNQVGSEQTRTSHATEPSHTVSLGAASAGILNGYSGTHYYDDFVIDCSSPTWPILPPLTPVTVTSVTPDSFQDTDTGIVIAGADFEAAQGGGSVVISPIDDIDGEASVAVEFLTFALGGTTTTTSCTLTIPAVEPNDVGIVEFTHRGTDDAAVADNVSGGWAVYHSRIFNTSFSGHTYWDRFDGAEDGGTITVSGATNSVACVLTVYRNAIASGNPFSGAATAVGEANASGNETQAEITTLVDNAMVVLVVLNSPDLAVATEANTSPGALAERAERLSTGGTDTSVVHSSALKATAGATGAFTWTQSDAANGSYAYAIQPRAAAGAAQAQTVTAWADDEITFTAVLGGGLLEDVTSYLFVENDSGGSNAVGFPVTFDSGSAPAVAPASQYYRRRRQN